MVDGGELHRTQGYGCIECFLVAPVANPHLGACRRRQTGECGLPAHPGNGFFVHGHHKIAGAQSRGGGGQTIEGLRDQKPFAVGQPRQSRSNADTPRLGLALARNNPVGTHKDRVSITQFCQDAVYGRLVQHILRRDFADVFLLKKVQGFPQHGEPLGHPHGASGATRFHQGHKGCPVVSAAFRLRPRTVHPRGVATQRTGRHRHQQEQGQQRHNNLGRDIRLRTPHGQCRTLAHRTGCGVVAQSGQNRSHDSVSMSRRIGRLPSTKDRVGIVRSPDQPPPASRRSAAGPPRYTDRHPRRNRRLRASRRVPPARSAHRASGLPR